MPYQSTSDQLKVGAGLLLSLNKGKQAVVTQQRMDSDPSVLVNNQRICHSPIKVTSDEEDREQLWSPSSSSVQGIGQLLGEDQYGLGTPSLSFRESKMGEVDSFLEASKRSVVGRQQQQQALLSRSSKDLEKKQAMLDRQRIISPTSSNEKPEDDATTDVENRPLQPKAWESHSSRQHYAPPPPPPSLSRHHQVWQHHPHAGPAVHHPPPRYAHPPYHQSAAAHYPPWGTIYGAPAPMYYSQHHGPHPGHNQSSGNGPHHQGQSSLPPQPVPSSHPYASAGILNTRSDPVERAKKLDRFNDLDWQAVDTHAASCIPIKHPTTNRSRLSEQPLPDFTRLVNFPEHMTRGRHFGMDPSGKKNCVMCGHERLSIAARTREDSTHIIPRQNKGVCTSCDVAVWLVLDLNTEIKWCKGCKNFRCWAAFGEKGLATKCIRCRLRQKEKYAEKCRLLS